MIDRHSVVTLFRKAEWTELAVTYEINRVLGENTIAYSTIGKYVREFICAPKDKHSFIVRQFEGDFTFDDRIAPVLAETPFLSLGQIAKRVMISKFAVYRHLTSGMRWRLKRLRWVPHGHADVEKSDPIPKSTGTFGHCEVCQASKLAIHRDAGRVLVLLGH